MVTQMRPPQGIVNPKLRSSAEYALFDQIERLEKNPELYIAVHIHFSRLQKQYRRDRYMRIAADTFEGLVKPLGGHIFPLSNNDIVFITRSQDSNEIAAAVNKLRILFQEDPLTQYTTHTDHGDFCTWYRLGLDYQAFYQAMRQIYESYERQLNLSELDQMANDRLRQGQPLSPMSLGHLEDTLAHADLSNIIRSQTVCTLPQNSETVTPVFREIFVSISDLQALLAPKIDLGSQYTLFRYLTLALDKRVIAWAYRENLGLSQAFSLNMNIATILSPEFQKLDQVVAGNLRGRVVMELQLADIFADMGAFLFARDWLQERGYRVCIDGLTHLTINYVDRARLGCDLVKLYWGGGIEEMPDTLLPTLKAQIAQTGQARTILCRCDNEQAVAYGHQAGIIMFQGRLIEQKLRAQSNSLY